MRALILAFTLIAACKYDRLPTLSDGGGGGDDGGGGIDACVGIGCNVVMCDPGMETKITGRVLLPNGTTPMANVDVYVPATDPGPMPMGPQCAQCGPLPGDPVVRTTTDSTGRFTLVNAPPGDDIPLVVTIGKWRRQARIPHVEQCAETIVGATETTLPKNRAEGDMPKIAISTGVADAIECVVRKAGVDDMEFGVQGGAQAIHMFAPPQSQGGGANRFSSGGNFPDSQTLWGNMGVLPYDVVILGCEGTQNPGNKPQTAMQVMQNYANTGGRIFATHSQSIWIGGEIGNTSHGPPEWTGLAQFSSTIPNPNGDLTIDASTADGMIFRDYEVGVSGASPGRIPMVPNTQRSSIVMIDQTRVRRVATTDTGVATNFVFTTPVNAMPNSRCGRVAFSDMHQGTGSTSSPNMPFPAGCTTQPLTPQDFAILYQLFDLQRCVPPN